MRRTIPVDLSYQRRAPRATAIPFAVDVAPGTILLRGGFSTGDSGWQLSASARRHRQRIVLFVIAAQATWPDEPSMEEYEYRATLCSLPVGRFHLQVRHVFRPPSGSGSASALVAFESVVLLS